MISFRHLRRGLCKFSSRRRLSTSCALDQGGTHEANASSVASLLVQSRQQPDSPSSTQAHAKMVATLLSECDDRRGLSRIHAHVIRSRLLDSNPVAFHRNNIIRAYARLDAPRKALLVYAFMARAGVPPDSYTLPIVLKTVCQSFDFEAGRQVHGVAVKHGLECNEFCESGFISLYAKAGDFGDARKAFDENADRKLGSWNAMIAGLAQGGRSREAIDLFIEMRRSGFVLDDVTLVSVTSACGSIGDLDLALQLHKYAFQAKNSEKADILMFNSLIDLYGKCGRMDLAYKVFLGMEERNVSSWTSMIVGYAMHGLVSDALECFRCMREAGMVQEGKRYFDMMQKYYGIRPRLQHYGCMVDLFGQAGRFDEAKEMVEGMPMKANSIIYGCLLGACEKHENVEIGEWVAKHLQELEQWNDGVYVVLSNIYAIRGMWKEVEEMRVAMK
ncbi:hypothetical protein ACJRO7_016239 [Eucalyptus globulus]|uniref:Pentatricopeptide repeat-containing protein n=1 Tax=Eucalyptus globulus TaxID=34317 RepID=A0ABD3LGK2_EUCGL